jgi:hypothetical protein
VRAAREQFEGWLTKRKESGIEEPAAYARGFSAEHDRARDVLVTKYATKEDDLSRWRATAFPVAITLRPAD